MKTKKLLLLIFVLVVVIFFLTEGIGFFKRILFPICKPVSPSTTDCSPQNESSTLDITVKEAIQVGFPLYLPSAETIKSMEISIPHYISFISHNETCSYLKMPIHLYGEENSNITMQVSNGCAYPLPSSMYTEEISLSWAKNGKAHVIEDSQGLSIIVIKEPIGGFQYLIFSEKPLTTTVEFLESMQYINE